MPVPAATPLSSVDLPAIPEILKNPQLLQMILAKLEAETQRAEAANWALAETAASRDEWKAIADKERARAEVLQTSIAARVEESAELRAANGYLRQSVAEYKAELTATRSALEKARSARKWYAVVGAGLGAAGAAAILR